MIDIEKEREAFEAHYGYPAKFVDGPMGGEYTTPALRAMWTGWLARAQQGAA
jgi:hypothetical protein